MSQEVWADPAAIRTSLSRLLGCAHIRRAADADAAWCAVFQTFGIGPADRVHLAVGAPPAIMRAVSACGASLVETDLHPAHGTPVWPAGPLLPSAGRDVFVLDHRHGLPGPPPATSERAIILEDATSAAGGSWGGQPIGSLGSASVVSLGDPPFSRSRGALIATDLAALADRWQVLPSLDEPGGVSGQDLAADLFAVDDWVAGCRAAAGVYDSVWRGLDLPPEPVRPVPGAVPTFSAYLVQANDPDALVAALAEAGIEARRPLNARLASLLADQATGLFPGARAFYGRTVRLPNHPDLDLGDLLYVADVVRRYLLAATARS